MGRWVVLDEARWNEGEGEAIPLETFSLRHDPPGAARFCGSGKARETIVRS